MLSSLLMSADLLSGSDAVMLSGGMLPFLINTISCAAFPGQTFQALDRSATFQWFSQGPLASCPAIRSMRCMLSLDLQTLQCCSVGMLPWFPGAIRRRSSDNEYAGRKPTLRFKDSGRCVWPAMVLVC